MVKIGRNDLCPCGSGKKYKKCCLNKRTPDIYQCIQDVISDKGYSGNLADTLCSMLRYMQKRQLFGGCHATASVLYVALSEQGFNTKLYVGEVSASNTKFFDHSWITIDSQIIDLACYMGLPDVCGRTVVSNPIVLSTDVITRQPPRLIYGIETGRGFDSQTELLLNTPFGQYMDEFPFETGGLWTVVQQILHKPVNRGLLRKKYANV